MRNELKCKYCGIYYSGLSELDIVQHKLECCEKHIAKLENNAQPAYCNDCFTLITNDDAYICGACADNLKAERDKLIAEVAKLKEEKYFYAAQMLDKYSEYMCPPDACGKERTNSGYCDGDNSDCTRCWHEFLMEEEK